MHGVCTHAIEHGMHAGEGRFQVVSLRQLGLSQEELTHAEAALLEQMFRNHLRTTAALSFASAFASAAAAAAAPKWGTATVRSYFSRVERY